MRYWFDTEFHEDGITIEPLSIGIVAADGREYYAETHLSVVGHTFCNPWVCENVLPHLKGGDAVKDRRVIAQEIKEFITGNSPEFWAYCGAYDWVVLNQLYGPMVDHPKKWPYYCNDIAQLCLHRGINRRDLPKQNSTEHHALEDARWNRDVYNWIYSQEGTHAEATE